MADKKQFSNTKSIVNVETGIVTLISYHHYLKIVGNKKLWTHLQKESWNIHGMKILICANTVNGTESYAYRTEGYVIVSNFHRVTYIIINEYKIVLLNNIIKKILVERAKVVHGSL